MLISWPYPPLQGNCVLPHKQYSSFLTTILQLISFHRWDSLKAKKSELLRFSRQACFLGLKILLVLEWDNLKAKKSEFLRFNRQVCNPHLNIFWNLHIFMDGAEFYSNVFIMSLFPSIDEGFYVNNCDVWSCCSAIFSTIAYLKQFINCEIRFCPVHTECNPSWQKSSVSKIFNLGFCF